MTNNQVIKKYEKLLEDVATKEFYKKKQEHVTNCYVCSCGKITKTVCKDVGVTPFLKRCDSCGLLAKSTFFKDIRPHEKPEFEWYRPDEEELLKLTEHEIEHILHGGLVSRKISE